MHVLKYWKLLHSSSNLPKEPYKLLEAYKEKTKEKKNRHRWFQFNQVLTNYGNQSLCVMAYKSQEAREGATTEFEAKQG